jgi:hypothetical protein
MTKYVVVFGMQHRAAFSELNLEGPAPLGEAEMRNARLALIGAVRSARALGPTPRSDEILREFVWR